MTDPMPEPEILAAGPPPRGSGDYASFETAAIPALVPALWLVTAAALVVAPFLSFTRYEIRREGELAAGYDANGWGHMTGLGDGTLTGSHTPRHGILLVLLAVILLIAAGAAWWRRAAAWPARLGAFASVMTLAVAAVLVLDQEAMLSNETTVRGISYDTTAGIGVGVVLIGAVAAGIALAVSLAAERRH